MRFGSAFLRIVTDRCLWGGVRRTIAGIEVIWSRLGGWRVGEDNGSEQARRRAAAYARQTSLWPAPSTGPQMPRRDRLRRIAGKTRMCVTAVVLLVGPPWVLWQAFGNPATLLSSWWASSPWS